MAASSNEFLQDLAKKPPAHKAAILFGVLGFVGFVYWQFMYSDLKQSKQKAQRTKKNLQKKRKGLDKALDAYLADKCRTGHEAPQTCAQHKKPYGELKGVGDEASRALPGSPEWGTFIEILQKKAQDATVRITSLDTKKEEGAGEYIKVPASIEVTGGFHEIMKFFYLLRPARPRDLSGPATATPNKNDPALQKVDRIVNVENLALNTDRVKEPGHLRATFLASTFYRKQLPKPITAAPAPGKKAAPGAPSGVQRLTNPGAGVPK